MKRITRLAAILLAVAMVFSGCATIESKMKINNDGIVTQNAKYEIEKDKCLSVMRKMDPEIKSNAEAEKSLKEFFNMMSSEPGTSCTFNTIQKNGKEYYSITISGSENIETYNSEMGDVLALSGEYLSKDTYYAVTDYTDLTSAYAEMGISAADMAAVKVTEVIEFPNKIVSSQGGTISSTNPNEITFEYTLNQKVTLFATTNSKVTIDSVKKEIEKRNQAILNTETIKKPSIKSLKVTSVKKKKGTVKIKFSKVKNTTYEVQYSTNKKFKKAKTKKSKKTTVSIKKLKAGKKYYFRVRAVEITEASYIKPEYSKYSKKKAIVIKKTKKSKKK
ncbi:MAG: fibronectin type III domain-containing protein [Eubacterium sp.]